MHERGFNNTTVITGPVNEIPISTESNTNSLNTLG